MGTKLSVLLFNTRGPWHWSCQHIAAVVTDMETGRKFDINYNAFEDATPQLDKSELGRYLKGECCVGVATLFSDKDFDTFFNTIRNKFPLKSYDCCSYNCADAVNFAIDELCSEKTCTEVSCFLYKLICCPLFFGSFAWSCFPSPPGCCTMPQDIYDKARWLSHFTSYGVEIKLEHTLESSSRLLKK